MPTGFFSKQEPQSVVKTEIVTSYFDAWSKIVGKHSPTIGYADLFSGPGRYEDGSESTPLMILRKAVHDPVLRGSLVTVFNDADSKHVADLRNEIGHLEGTETLKHPPLVLNEETGIGTLRGTPALRNIPTFYFIDPFGYRGLTNELIQSAIAGWGSECVFFFNYNRVNAAITNASVRSTMDGLFGEPRAHSLRQMVETLSPSAREKAVVDEIVASIRDVGGKFVIPFRFRDAAHKRTSHYVVFISKNIRGYTIMKEIMAKRSKAIRGIPMFEWAPDRAMQLKLEDFDSDDPYSIDALKKYLLEACGGTRISVGELYDRYNVNIPILEAAF